MTKFDDMPHMKVDPNAPLVVDDKVIPRGIDFVMKFNGFRERNPLDL